MYLVAIHVPIFVAGERRHLASDWKRSLELLRDSIREPFGELTVIAPSLPAEVNSSAQTLSEVSLEHDAIRLLPSFDARCGRRDFWLSKRKRWIDELEGVVPRADVVHGVLEDLYRPIAYAGLQVAWRRNVTTVFVQDTDIVLQRNQLARGAAFKKKLELLAYGRLYDRMLRRATRRADLALLKGSRLMARYGVGAKNPREFHDTSYSLSDIVPASVVEARLAQYSSAGPLRFVYCGRLEARKGLDHSASMISRAVARGADVSLDVIGDGTERDNIVRQIAALGIGERMRLLGSAAYGPELLAKLAEYDALLFTPLAEDTPRMIFDGYAAALPLVAYDIDYVRERAESEHATVLLASGDVDGAAEKLVQLSRDRSTLRPLTEAARRAAEYHAAENWYRRRAEWTVEAYEQKKALGIRH